MDINDQRDYAEEAANRREMEAEAEAEAPAEAGFSAILCALHNVLGCTECTPGVMRW